MSLKDKFPRKVTRERKDVTDILAPVVSLDGERVYVQALPSADRDAYEISRAKPVDLPGGKVRHVLDLTNTKAKLVVMALVGEDGARIFADEDAEWFGQYPAGIVDRLYDIARELAGMVDEDEASKKPVGTVGVDSPTVSPKS